MTFDVVSTGSKGNAVVINDSILIDCGVPLRMLTPHIKGLKLVLLTHEHGDHFNPSTVRSLHARRPALRFGGCEWMIPHLLKAGVAKRVIDAYTPCQWVQYGENIRIMPENLVHNVPNCGYHLMFGGEKMFYATDTGSLSAIEARAYDWYLVEANHTKAEITARIARKKAAGEYPYELQAMENHLSQEKAENWLYQQMGARSQYVFLHGHEEHSHEITC